MKFAVKPWIALTSFAFSLNLVACGDERAQPADAIASDTAAADATASDAKPADTATQDTANGDVAGQETKDTGGLDASPAGTDATTGDTATADVLPGTDATTAELGPSVDVVAVDTVPSLDTGSDATAGKMHKVVAVGGKSFAFEPAVLTIAPGDSVEFTVAKNHNVVEVTKQSWDKDENQPKAEGFTVDFGQTKVIAFPQAGTFYYVCSPHAEMGMKGTVIVK